MIKQKKDVNIPQSLTNTKKYDGEDVKKALINDQNEKCYLCERKLETDFVIEHFRSQANNEKLKLDWNNLFLSCSYCNGKKLDDYDDIINPLDVEVENVIKQELDFAGDKAKFTALTSDSSVDKTIQLLNLIFNGKGICRKLKEDRFFKHICSTINDFMRLIENYHYNPSDTNKQAVIADLSITQEALGFKYWIIKSNPILEQTFAPYVQWNK